MSWHYLPEPVGEFSLPEYLASIPLQHARLTPPPAPSSSPDKETESSPTSPSGMTSAHLTVHRGAAESTSLQADSPARISALPEKGPGLPAPAPAYGQKCTESFAKFAPATHSWKTPQSSFLEDLDTFSQTWPQAGIMLRGSCWALQTVEPRTSGKESGSLPGIQTYPTPTCQDAKNNGSPSQKRRRTPPLNAVCGGPLNPGFVEWLMGWPIGWTDLEPLGTGKFLSWLQQHSLPSGTS